MIKQTTFAILTACFFFISCSSPKYIHDKLSYERQKELQKNRSGNVISVFGMGVASVFSASVLEVDMGWYPSEQEFKKINLINPTKDTIYLNLLTDVFWDKDDYCDFMDIRIPPTANSKILVPVNANYNLYFSNTPDKDDDEMLEIYTGDHKNISLYPGLTILKDTVNLNQ